MLVELKAARSQVQRHREASLKVEPQLVRLQKQGPAAARAPGLLTLAQRRARLAAEAAVAAAAAAALTAFYI